MVEILSSYECYSHTIDQFNIKGERGPMSNEHWLAISHDLAVYFLYSSILKDITSWLARPWMGHSIFILNFFNFVFKLHVGLVLKIFCE